MRNIIMTTTAKLYASVVALTGFITLTAVLAYAPEFPDLNRYIALLALACIAAVLKVKVPTFNGNISISFIFILIGVAAMSLTETLILGALATLLQCTWK